VPASFRLFAALAPLTLARRLPRPGSGALFLFLPLLAAGCDSAPGPADAVTAFYAEYLREPVAGLPSGPRLDRLRPYLSSKLEELVDGALACQAEVIARQSAASPSSGEPVAEEKPPFVDGDYFSSLFEGPRSFRVGRAVESNGEWRVPVVFGFDATVPEWEDVVVVRREDDAWVIDDILFAGAGEFNPPGRLSENLAFTVCE
jgi:hypothetical protein